MSAGNSALEFLGGALGHQAPVLQHGDLVSELIGLCARLPLALRDVAARVAARPGLPLPWLAAEMRDARAAAGEEPELQLDGADQNGLDAFPVEK